MKPSISDLHASSKLVGPLNYQRPDTVARSPGANEEVSLVKS